MVRRGAIAGQRNVPEHRDPQESPDIGVVRVGLERVPEEDQQVERLLGDPGADLLVATQWSALQLVDGDRQVLQSSNSAFSLSWATSAMRFVVVAGSGVSMSCAMARHASWTWER